MNNKGFGIINVMIFAIIVVFAVFLFYSFVTQVLDFVPESHILNYENEYSQYEKSSTNNNIAIVVNSINKTKYNSYNDIEKVVSSAAEKYVNDFYSNIYNNDCLYIKISTLQNYGYIDTIQDIRNSNTMCTGYIKVTKIGNNLTYNAYINCGNNYTTDNYISRLDN